MHSRVNLQQGKQTPSPGFQGDDCFGSLASCHVNVGLVEVSSSRVPKSIVPSIDTGGVRADENNRCWRAVSKFPKLALS